MAIAVTKKAIVDSHSRVCRSREREYVNDVIISVEYASNPSVSAFVRKCTRYFVV